MQTDLTRVLDYIENHPDKDKVFKGWTREQLAAAIARAVKETAFAVFEDGNNIKGIVLASPDYYSRVLRIIGIISDEPEALYLFLEKYKVFYPGWTIAGKRRGKEKKFNIETISRLWNSAYRRKNSLSLI